MSLRIRWRSYRTERAVVSRHQRNTTGLRSNLGWLWGVVMKSRMSDAVQSEIWDRYERGENYTDIGRAVGRSLTTVRSFVMRHDYRRPATATVWSSARLSLLDREEISRQLVAGCSFRAIARMLGRAPSTVSRKVNVNGP